MGAFKDTKETLFIWLGFIVYGAFEILFSILNFHFIDKSLCAVSTSVCDYYYLIGVGFFFSGIAKIVGFLPKLNDKKLIALIVCIVHAVMMFFGVVGMAGISNETTGFSSASTSNKANLLRDGVLLFGSSVCLSHSFVRSGFRSTLWDSSAISRNQIDRFINYSF